MRGGALAAALAALASLPVGAAAVPPPSLGLAVWPARATVVGGQTQVIHVRNGGVRPVVVDASAAGFSLDLRGTPRIVPAVGAARWLAVRPRSIRVAPGATATFTAWPRVPPGARPGDHPALVLLRTRPMTGRAIGVLVRVGVVLDVRVGGRVRRLLELRSLRVLRRGRQRRLLLAIVNAGDLTERIGPPASLELFAGRTLVARLRPRRRELLPHSRGIVEFLYAGRRRGIIRAVFDGRGLGGRVFHVRL